MKTQTIIFDVPKAKKHSVRYDTTQSEAVIGSIYVLRTAFDGKEAPKKLKVTIEAVS